MGNLLRMILITTVAGGCGATGPLDLVAPAQPVDLARVRIVVPEVYELANVIVATTAWAG